MNGADLGSELSFPVHNDPQSCSHLILLLQDQIATLKHLLPSLKASR